MRMFCSAAVVLLQVMIASIIHSLTLSYITVLQLKIYKFVVLLCYITRFLMLFGLLSVKKFV